MHKILYTKLVGWPPKGCLRCTNMAAHRADLYDIGAKYADVCTLRELELALD